MNQARKVNINQVSNKFFQSQQPNHQSFLNKFNSDLQYQKFSFSKLNKFQKVFPDINIVQKTGISPNLQKDSDQFTLDKQFEQRDKKIQQQDKKNNLSERYTNEGVCKILLLAFSIPLLLLILFGVLSLSVPIKSEDKGNTGKVKIQLQLQDGIIQKQITRSKGQNMNLNLIQPILLTQPVIYPTQVQVSHAPLRPQSSISAIPSPIISSADVIQSHLQSTPKTIVEVRQNPSKYVIPTTKVQGSVNKNEIQRTGQNQVSEVRQRVQNVSNFVEKVPKIKKQKAKRFQ